MGCCMSGAVGLGDSNRVSNKDLEDLEVLFFDCDDTLYQNSWATAERLKSSIERYTVEELGLDENAAFELYLEHGTALRGLMKHNHLPEDKIEHFLTEVHDVSLEEIGPRPELREMILKLGHKRRWVFTASIKEHAERCLKLLGIDDLFEGIVDCRSVGLQTKHDPASFVIAMEMANIADPKKCILFDDSVKNMQTARRIGLKTCLVGLKERGTGKPIVCPEADFMVDDLLELPDVMPALFRAPKDSGGARLSGEVAVFSDPLVVDADDAKSAETGEAPEEHVIDEGGERRIVVVLGGPGSGKGTQCARLVESFASLEHLSAGDLLREERGDPSSEHAQLIEDCIKEGKLVPSWITMKLIVKAMNRSDALTFLVDGCPRDTENYETFYEHIIDAGEARLVGVLYYECEEEDMLARIMNRAATSAEGQVRADDNVETAKKRFATFNQKTLPVVDTFREQDLLYTVDAARSIDEVFHDTVSCFTVMMKGTEVPRSRRKSRLPSFRRRSTRKELSSQ